MTVFLSVNNRELNIDNSLNDGHIQIHEHLVVKKAEMESIFSSEHNDKNIIENVDTDLCKKGRALISGAFDPCNAVVAKLKTGEYAMYHARNGYKGVVGVSDNARITRMFLEEIKDQIEELYVFEKKNPTANAGKSPELTVALSIYVDSSVPVNRINIEGYRYVLCDSKKNQILLFRKVGYEADFEKAKHEEKYADPGRAINLQTEAIPIEETVKQVSTARFSQEIKKDSHGNFVYNDNLRIPARFSSCIHSKAMQPDTDTQQKYS